MPDKSQASLVNYYYMWKKSRNNKSLIDVQQLSKNALAESAGGSETKEAGYNRFEKDQVEMDDEEEINYNVKFKAFSKH